MTLLIQTSRFHILHRYAQTSMGMLKTADIGLVESRAGEQTATSIHKPRTFYQERSKLHRYKISIRH